MKRVPYKFKVSQKVVSHGFTGHVLARWRQGRENNVDNMYAVDFYHNKRSAEVESPVHGGQTTARFVLREVCLQAL